MNKIYIADGNCIFHDPGPEMIPLFLNIDPNYTIMSIRPGKDFMPRFQLLKDKNVVLEKSPFEYSTSHLMEVLTGEISYVSGNKYSALDLLYAVSLMALKNCSLCGWLCGINRFQNEKGRCGLGSIVGCGSLPFAHIAEEPPINPSLVTNFSGCSLRCKYCIEHESWDTSNKLVPLDAQKFWIHAEELILENKGDINSLEFTNATESLHGVVNLLLNAPIGFRLPVVLNTHLYGSELFYRIANQISDVWLVDFRYGNNDCGKSLSGVEGYMEQALIGLDSICKKGNRVIVRILVLPGHFSCCHEPSLELLAKYKDFVWVSVLDQYVPENEAHLDPNLSRRPTRKEIEKVEKFVKKHGLRDISNAGNEFWGM